MDDLLAKALTSLTSAQKAELRTLKVSDQLRHDWKAGRVKPTLAQAAILEAMTGLPEHSLRDWLMIEKATPEQRAWLQRAAGKLRRGAVVTLSYGGAGAAVFAALGERLATMYKASRKRPQLRSGHR
jgi:hypothetical protein